MSRRDVVTEFDAYHKWLGIPPTEQPPDCYRLLGVVRFESDAEVIAAAADRQMAHVKSFATGQHAAASQKLLNELAKARVTLLNGATKRIYDRKLQDQANARAAKQNAATRGVPASPSASEAPTIVPRPTVRVTAPRLDKRRRSNMAIQWMIVAAGAAAVGVALVVAANTGPKRAPAAASISTAAPKRLSRPVQPPLVSGPKAVASREVPLGVAPAEPQAAEELPRERLRPSAVRQEKEERQAAVREKRFVHNLDLETRVQRVPLATADYRKIEVVGMQDCNSQHQIIPPDGVLRDGRNVTIKISDIRPAVWEISIDRRTDSQILLRVEGFIETDDGEQIPLTLANIGRIRRLALKAFEQANRSLIALQTESANLTRWLNGPGMKPLATVGTAKARLRELSQIVPEQSALATRLEADLAVAEKVQDFAQHLHDDCLIEFIAEELVGGSDEE